MATSQPIWQMVENLGDADPFTYGGAFVYRDLTGVYPPEMEVLEEPLDGQGSDKRWTACRLVLEPCTFIDETLSDNPYHPSYPAWFADSLASLASGVEMDEAEFAAMFASDDPATRASAYLDVVRYYGPYQFDQEPLTMTWREVFGRYMSAFRAMKRRNRAKSAAQNAAV